MGCRKASRRTGSRVTKYMAEYVWRRRRSWGWSSSQGLRGRGGECGDGVAWSQWCLRLVLLIRRVEYQRTTVQKALSCGRSVGMRKWVGRRCCEGLASLLRCDDECVKLRFDQLRRETLLTCITSGAQECGVGCYARIVGGGSGSKYRRRQRGALRAGSRCCSVSALECVQLSTSTSSCVQAGERRRRGVKLGEGAPTSCVSGD